jgi:hypothetical protein
MGTNWLGYNSVSPTKGYRQYSYYPNAHALTDYPGKFYVEFFVKTERPLNLSVDQFLLTLPNGKSKKPVAYPGALAMNSTTNYSLTLCRPNLPQETPADVPIVLRESESMCFAVIYDVDPPMPSDSFRLKVSGVSIDGEKLKIPSLVFEPTKEISLHP